MKNIEARGKEEGGRSKEKVRVSKKYKARKNEEEV